jgi:hypothetical protein
VNSLERVADGSLSRHDYAFSPAALDAIALQRVSAALDLTRSRRTLYPSAWSSSWGRPQPYFETCGQLALQLMTAEAFASVMFLAVGRWALVPTWLLFLCSETVRRVEDLAAVASATVRAHVGVAFHRAPMSTQCATPATSTPPARATRDGIGRLDSGVCWRLIGLAQ